MRVGSMLLISSVGSLVLSSGTIRCLAVTTRGKTVMGVSAITMVATVLEVGPSLRYVGL
jgi:hypothetical protein